MINLFIGLILHFVGDYLLQNHWMATEKTKNFFPAFIHATIYSVPFFSITDFKFWIIIYTTHFFIDRYRLAVFWIKLVNWNWKSENFGYHKDTPIWLLFIVDNTWHIIINSICIYYSI